VTGPRSDGPEGRLSPLLVLLVSNCRPDQVMLVDGGVVIFYDPDEARP
jgi:hypothetical protein